LRLKWKRHGTEENELKLKHMTVTGLPYSRTALSAAVVVMPPPDWPCLVDLGQWAEIEPADFAVAPDIALILAG
jgi:hypothetical protein